jgi:hypothetical protein
VTWTEVDQLPAMHDAGIDIDEIVKVARAVGYTAAQVRKIVAGGYLRGVAISWDLLCPTQVGERKLRDLLDRDSVVVDDIVPLLDSHDWANRLGTVTSIRSTGYGLEVEAHVDRGRVAEVEARIPCGLSASLPPIR